jgi:hypothetical protein
VAALKKVLLVLALALLPACPCAQGPDLLNIWVSPLDDSGVCDWETIAWGGVTEIARGDFILVVYQNDDHPKTAVELYDGDQRLALAETTETSTCQHGCPSPRTWYLIDFDPGEYTLVHRESAGTDKPVHTPGAVSDDPWTTFDGERALVSTLMVTAAGTSSTEK